MQRRVASAGSVAQVTRRLRGTRRQSNKKEPRQGFSAEDVRLAGALLQRRLSSSFGPASSDPKRASQPPPHCLACANAARASGRFLTVGPSAVQGDSFGFSLTFVHRFAARGKAAAD